MLYYFKRYFIVFIIISAFLMILSPRYASAVESIKGKYFNVYIADGIDKVELLRKLRASYFLRLDAGKR